MPKLPNALVDLVSLTLPLLVIAPAGYGPASVSGMTVDVSGGSSGLPKGSRLGTSATERLRADVSALMTTASSASAYASDAPMVMTAMHNQHFKRVDMCIR